MDMLWTKVSFSEIYVEKQKLEISFGNQPSASKETNKAKIF